MRNEAAKERSRAEASDGDERATHEEAARWLDDTASFYEQLASVYERQDEGDWDWE
jgi:hypothetical protein